MYVEFFTEEQQGVFLDLIDHLINADGVLEEHEIIKFEEFKSALPNAKQKHVELNELKTIFTTRKKRLAVLAELTLIALMRGFINSYDYKFLKDITNVLNLKEEDFGWMIMWSKNMHFITNSITEYIEN